MLDESQRVSSDRLLRFQQNKKEKIVERVCTPQNFYKDTALTFGDYVIFLESEKKDLNFIIDQIVSFAFDTSSRMKKDRKFDLIFLYWKLFLMLMLSFPALFFFDKVLNLIKKIFFEY
jgi:hypothetical protein